MQEKYGNVQLITLLQWNVIGEGKLAVVTSNVQLESADGEIPSKGLKQVLVLNHDTDGRWLIKTVIFNEGI